MQVILKEIGKTGDPSETYIDAGKEKEEIVHNLKATGGGPGSKK